MKSFPRFLIPFLFMMLLSPVLNAQWIPAQGMDGVDVSDMVVTDSMIFISTCDLGVQARNINEGTWRQILLDQPSYLLKTGVYLFTRNYQYNLRSHDNGNHWDTLPMFTTGPIIALDTVLFCSRNDSLWRSVDYGDSWVCSNSNLPTLFFPILYSTGNKLIVRNDYPFKLFISADLGNTWDSLSISGLDLISPTFHAICEYHSQLFLCASHAMACGIYKYNYNLKEWIKLNDTLYISEFAEFSDRLFGCNNYTYELDTIFGEWMVRKEGLECPGVRCLSANAEYLFCGSNYGPYKTDTSLIWDPYYQGLHGGSIYSLTSGKHDLWACSRYGIYKSENNGSLFERKLYDNVPGFFRMILTDSLYFGNGYDLYISEDQGISWNKPDIEYAIGEYNGSDIARGNGTFYYRFGSNIYRTHDPFVLWDSIPLPPSPYYNSIVAGDSTLLISKNWYQMLDNPVIISHDYGNTFEAISAYKHGYQPFIKYDHHTFFMGEGNRLYFSRNEGNTWDSLAIPVADFEITTCAENDQAMIIAGFGARAPGSGTGYLPYVYITYDTGVNWQDVTGSIKDCKSYETESLMITGSRILIGTLTSGLWYRDDLLAGVEPIKKNPLSSLKLFPNPASDKINIVFTLAEKSEGEIIIHDLLGRVIASSGQTPCQKGNNQVSINVEDLPQGMYILSLLLDGKTYSQKFCRE